VAIACVYCGKNPGTTSDHVPPKNLFPHPRPVDTVTVPCCIKCQAEFKKDEDAFMAWVTFGPAGESPAGKLLWEQKLHRTYQKDAGLKKAIARSFKNINLETFEGIYLGERLAISIDPERKNNVLKKIVKGLFWVEYKERLPVNASVEIYGIPGKGEPVNSLIAVTQEATTAWEGIFEYRHARAPESFESYWVMSFYRRNYFVAMVDGIKEEEQTEKVHNEQVPLDDIFQMRLIFVLYKRTVNLVTLDIINVERYYLLV
jgi:hypothetical protein